MGILFLFPAVTAVFYGEKEGLVYLFTGLSCFIAGTLGSMKKPKNKVFYAREGFVCVSLSWIMLSLIGAFPFYLTGEIPHYTDALFEVVSGFTTTGSSILTDVEKMSYTSMFFRCLTNWIGGMGVLVFIMSVLPLAGSYNMHLMRAESTGAEVGKIVPKIKDTAKILYGMYIGLSVILVISFLISGLSFYDSLILSFSTMGTGGFANLNSSLGGYSASVQTIACIFMIISGINFNAYYLLSHKKFKEFLKMEEVRIYLLIVFSGALLITFQIRGLFTSFKEAFHHAIFQLASVMTTTGFATVDFNLWPTFSKCILLMVMVIGGCAGSTSGGIKVSRVIILLRTLKKENNHLIHPRSVKRMRFNDSPILPETQKSVHSFIIAYVLLIVLSTLLVSLDGYDFTSTFTAVLSSVGNVGPGLELVGPSGNYGFFSDFSKLVLIFDMLAGRLEIFPLMVLFNINTWKNR